MANEMPWKQVARDWSPLERREDVRSEDWVRLVPVVGPELAELGPAKPVPLDADGVPLHARERPIDRKLTPLHDLMQPGAGPDLVCSERLVRALESSGATGWTATLVPHVTPNRVAGHRLYRLDTEGHTGPLVDTQLRLNKLNPQTFHPRGTDERLNGIPLTPVRFDARGWSGHSVCWSPWFNGPRSWWRALLVRGDVFLALQKHLETLVLRIDRVSWEGEAHARPVQPGHRQGPQEPPPEAPGLEEVLARVEGEAERYQHTFSAGASDAEIAQDFGRLGLTPPEPLHRLLARHNGARLFQGALVLHGVGAQGSLVSSNEELVQYPWYRREPGWVVFAEAAGGQVLWAVDARGHVRGLGRDEIVYGPDAPLHQWFSDQVADLRYAWDHDGQLPWTERVLRG
ncbi:MAG TPA: hypothetical protein VFZ09_44815 [Archangium sp.]|uniref:hypothetical protein n=1 Tax=Archangium sp. TaxID=1872627 RepID=UPI002E301186|nr:hypothetical protein [Archangium sp.]HEX5753404.1 hypothetical protein [Archangium sp.]